MRLETQIHECGSLVETADGSYIAPCAVVHGAVERSVLSHGVIVEKGAVVGYSVLMDSVYVGEEALVERAILDDSVWVCKESRVGVAPPWEGDESDTTLLAHGTFIPPRSLVPYNCVIQGVPAHLKELLSLLEPALSPGRQYTPGFWTTRES